MHMFWTSLPHSAEVLQCRQVPEGRSIRNCRKSAGPPLDVYGHLWFSEASICWPTAWHGIHLCGKQREIVGMVSYSSKIWLVGEESLAIEAMTDAIAIHAPSCPLERDQVLTMVYLCWTLSMAFSLFLPGFLHGAGLRETKVKFSSCCP